MGMQRGAFGGPVIGGGRLGGGLGIGGGFGGVVFAGGMAPVAPHRQNRNRNFGGMGGMGMEMGNFPMGGRGGVPRRPRGHRGQGWGDMGMDIGAMGGIEMGGFEIPGTVTLFSLSCPRP
jgi:hypothetical protein